MNDVIYLAGGCYWGVEKYMASIKGVVATEVGFANGFVENPTYQQVRYSETGHAETVKVTYHREELPLETLLRLFWLIIDPTTVDQQGEDVGHQYRTGVYWTQVEDEMVVKDALAQLATQYEVPLAVEACTLASFWTAEEYHQKYLDKNPGGYCHVPFGRIAWVAGIDPLTWDGTSDY